MEMLLSSLSLYRQAKLHELSEKRLHLNRPIEYMFWNFDFEENITVYVSLQLSEDVLSNRPTYGI